MVSVIVVNWNSGPHLERCVRSLETHAADCEIILVDNASDDGSLEFLSHGKATIQVYRNQQNRGFAAASNFGWRISKGEPVLFLNPDAQCTEGAVRRLENTFLDDERIWAVGGLLSEPSGRTQRGFNVRAFPTVASLAAEMLMLEEVWPGNPWTRRYRMSDWDHSDVRDVDQPAAACLMVRRRALKDLGGFDEAFHPAWFEDVDLCRRIHDAGGRILFQPAARFLHQGGASLQRLPWDEFLRCYHGNQVRYFAKHYGPETARRARTVIIVGLRLRSALSWLTPIAPGASRARSARIFWRAARQISSHQGAAA
jgi:N-acetylglucosaminyl-diphospho-decaprenol L-rhamnosyltransferase